MLSMFLLLVLLLLSLLLPPVWLFVAPENASPRGVLREGQGKVSREFPAFESVRSWFWEAFLIGSFVLLEI